MSRRIAISLALVATILGCSVCVGAVLIPAFGIGAGVGFAFGLIDMWVVGFLLDAVNTPGSRLPEPDQT
jgi:hypothetical protein